MFPIRMIYKDPTSVVNKPHEVDVYYFHAEPTTDSYGDTCIITVATCWMLDNEYWITVPVYELTPIKEKEALNE